MLCLEGLEFHRLVWEWPFTIIYFPNPNLVPPWATNAHGTSSRDHHVAATCDNPMPIVGKNQILYSGRLSHFDEIKFVSYDIIGAHVLGNDPHEWAVTVSKLYTHRRTELERRIPCDKPPEQPLQGSGSHELASGGEGKERSRAGNSFLSTDIGNKYDLFG